MKKQIIILLILSICFLLTKNFNEIIDNKSAVSENTNYILLRSLKKEIDYTIKPFQSFSYIVSDLRSGNTIYNYNSSMPSASMIKVFIMAKAMENVKEKKMDLSDIIDIYPVDKVGGSGDLQYIEGIIRTTVYELIEKMIIDSDNTATNVLIDAIGMNNINQYIKENGYNDSILQRKMMDFYALKNGVDNFTSVKDLRKIFRKMYSNECVSPEYDKKMLEILKKQKDNDKIPRYFLKNVIVAHKTGELFNVFNDGGIVYGINNNFIIVIMTDNVYDEECIKEKIGEVSKKIYFALD